MSTDAFSRSQQLYSLLQPYAARLQVILERLAEDNPLEAIAQDGQAPKEFVALAKSVCKLPAGELAAVLKEVIAADKSREKNSLDLKPLQELVTRLEGQIRSVGNSAQAFAKQGIRMPTPLPPDLQEALWGEAARLERDITGMRARMIREHDLRILRKAKVPAERVAAIVRDAPKQKDVDELTAQLKKVRRLLKDSTAAATLAERRKTLQTFTRAAQESLGPLLDPVVMHQLREFAQPIFKHDNRHAPKE